MWSASNFLAIDVDDNDNKNEYITLLVQTEFASAVAPPHTLYGNIYLPTPIQVLLAPNLLMNNTMDDHVDNDDLAVAFHLLKPKKGDVWQWPQLHQQVLDSWLVVQLGCC